MFDGVRQQRQGERYLAVLFQDSTLQVFRLPSKEGAVGLPDAHWWRIETWCRDFGLEQPDQPVMPDSVIACRDEQLAGRTEWRWALSGRNLGQNTDDLETARFILQGNEIVIRSP